MIHATLRHILGEHARQAGSLIEPGRLRFDFSHPSSVPIEVLEQAELEANRRLAQDDVVRIFETSMDEAQALGATALFGEKYGSIVRVVEIGDYSRELCGGTHVGRTGTVAVIRLLREGSIGAGMRRIEALVGPDALREINVERALLRDLVGALDAKDPRAALERARRVVDENKRMRNELGKLRAGGRDQLIAALADGVRDVDGVALVTAEVPDLDPGELRELALKVRDRLQDRPAVIVVGNGAGGKAMLVAAATTGAIERGVTAPAVLADAAAAVGGGAGGKDQLANAGGTRAERVPDALGTIPARLAHAPGRRVSATAPGRVLGLDLGDVRIGAAISDPDRRVAVRARHDPRRAAARRAVGRCGAGPSPRRHDHRDRRAAVHGRQPWHARIPCGGLRRRGSGGGGGAGRAAGRATVHGGGVEGIARCGREREAAARGDRRVGGAGDPAGLARRRTRPARARGLRPTPGPGYPAPSMDDGRPSYLAETDATSERRRRRVAAIALLVVFCVLAVAVAAGANTYRRCGEPPDADGRSVAIVVPEGATGQEVVQQLADQGLIRCGGFVGNLLLRGTGQATAILAGSYDVPVGSSLDQILALMTTPPQEVRTVRATIPEGLRIRSTFPGERSTSSVIEQQTGVPASVFAKLAESGRYTLPPYLPKGRSAEGFLFPDTYEFVQEGSRRRRDHPPHARAVRYRGHRSGPGRRRQGARPDALPGGHRRLDDRTRGAGRSRIARRSPASSTTDSMQGRRSGSTRPCCTTIPRRTGS